MNFKEQNSTDISLESREVVQAYVDGSFSEEKRKYSYGVVIIIQNKVAAEISDVGSDNDLLTMRNVSGEILGAMNAIKWASERNYKQIEIFYDYLGIEKWATGDWKANKDGTKRYVDFINHYRKDINISFIKVKAHSGVEFNERADTLASEAMFGKVKEPILKIEDSNIILKTLSDLVAEENKKIGTFTAELNNYKKIVQYNTLKEDLQKKEAAIVQPQLFINTIEDKFKIIEKEINKINDSYSFAQIVNNNESAIQQYFNYLNPNVSSYRNLHFNIDDVNSSLELEIVNNDSTVRADNVLSSGQLNVLAIAIFIAKNIGQKDSLIDFIAIDDPIQNMDDINQFSMIDVLSQLKKQVIFTTHDSKYVNLFLKKMNCD